MRSKSFFSVLLITFLLTLVLVAPSHGLDQEKAGESNLSRADNFSLKAKQLIIPHDIFALTAMPGEGLELQTVMVPARLKQSNYVLANPGGREVRIQRSRQGWSLTAPKSPGIYPLSLKDGGGRVLKRMNLIVKVPHSNQGDGFLNGYRIGKYEQKPLKGNPQYQVPRGFVELNSDNRQTLVSPNFRLGQFACKQKEINGKQYIVLNELLVLKLELILAALQAKGQEIETLYIMSGFRTPFYNKAIGNQTVYSRHLYGGAGDIFVDEDRNGFMDDLNGDGKTDTADAQYLADTVTELSRMPGYEPFLGGLSVYKTRPGVRGPFVHVDVRGYKARW